MGEVRPLFDRRSPREADQHITAISRDRTADERRYTTGLDNVDNSAKLMRPGGFIVVGAREGQGKTSYIERLALQNARDHTVLIVSLDMPPQVIQDRILAKALSVTTEELAAMTERNDPRYERTMNRLREHDLRIWRPTKGRKSAQKILEHAEEIEAAILIVDYCRLLDGWLPGNTAKDIVDYIADWTSASGTTTILLTQLKDEAVNRRPHNGHIQDTTQLAQRADRVQLIYRPYHGRGPKDTVAEILTTKNRWGPPCKNHVGWIGDTMDFYPYTGEEEANARCCRSTS